MLCFEEKKNGVEKALMGGYLVRKSLLNVTRGCFKLETKLRVGSLCGNLNQGFSNYGS